MKLDNACMKQEKYVMMQEIADMKLEKASMKLGLNKLTFVLQHFVGSDNDVRFSTGFSNYSTLASFYESLPPSAM